MFRCMVKVLVHVKKRNTTQTVVFAISKKKCHFIIIDVLYTTFSDSNILKDQYNIVIVIKLSFYETF